MKKIIFMFILFSKPIFVLGQIELDRNNYENTIKPFLKDAIINYQKEEKKFNIKNQKKRNIDLSDTMNIKIIIPIVTMKDIGTYDSLQNLIDFKLNDENQLAFIESKKDEFYAIKITKNIYETWSQYNKETNFENPKQVHDAGGYIFFPDNDDIFSNYFKLKDFIKENQDIFIFSIFNLDGLWGIRENRFIYISLQRNKIITTDAEKYYKEKYLVNGENCIKRLIYGYPCEQLIYKSKER